MHFSPVLSVLIITALSTVALILALSLLARERRRTWRRARDPRALFEVSRQTTANLDQQQMLDLVVQAVQDVVGYQVASVLLLDASRQELVAHAISSNLRGRIPVGDRIPIGRSLAQRRGTETGRGHPGHRNALAGWFLGHPPAENPAQPAGGHLALHPRRPALSPARRRGRQRWIYREKRRLDPSDPGTAPRPGLKKVRQVIKVVLRSNRSITK